MEVRFHAFPIKKKSHLVQSDLQSVRAWFIWGHILLHLASTPHFQADYLIRFLLPRYYTLFRTMGRTDASSGAGDIDDVASELQVTSLSAKNDALVLLFKYARASDSSAESREMPDLEAACPGLLKVVTIPNRKPLVAVLPFCNWDVAAKAVVGLWELRLQGVHFFTPVLPEEDQDNGAYKRRVHRELKEVFLGYLATLESGEAVSKCKSELESLKNDLLKIQQKLKRRNSVALWTQLSAEKSDTLMQIQMMAEQLAEYLNGLKSLELAIHSRCSERHGEEYVDEINDETLLLRLGNDWTWHQLHCLMERETRRFKERLPLYAKRSDILRHIHNNQVLVLNGETGSGKSTQLVQYMVDAGFIKDGFSVVCTQPRRVAVMMLFERVNEESKGCSRLDPLVGHLMSPAFRTEHFPKIMYITDHTLLQLCLVDSNFSQFGCVIVDEAHERSLNTDLLLAMLKKCLPKRPDLKVIIMSATADAALLSSYFGGCIMYQVVGRSFPVRFIYEAGEEDDLQDTDNRQRHPGYSRHALQVMHTVASINSGPEEGDVLAFLTSQAEIEWACSQHFGSSAIVLPLHGRLQAGEQQLVFKTTPDGMRKIVFATNVAETSLTIPGIKFVVDCGLAKESCVDPRTGMNILKVCKIDRSAAMQRAGRAGRTQAGVCYRLYSRLDFEAMAPHRMPEILRVHLGVAVLKLMALGVQKIESFDFIDSPNPAAISLAVENLRQLGAIAIKDGKTHLTSLGWQLAKLGGDPRLAFIALKSISEGLGREGLVIAGLLSCSGSIFFRAGSDEEKLRSDCLKMRFCHPYGDIFTLLSVFQEWDMVPESRRNKWCVQNSINAKSMRRCRDCVKEMEGCLKTELQVDVSPLWTWSVNASEDCNVMLRKVLISAMPKNLAVFSGHECLGYDVVCFGKQAFLHPSSSLLVFGQSPVWVVFGELLCTTREFLTSVTVVEPEWLSEITPLLPYDIPALLSSRMSKTVIPSLSRCLLSRICGKSNVALKFLSKKIQQGGHQQCILEADYEKQEFLTKKTQQGGHQRCILEADYEKQEFHIYTTPDLMEGAEILVKDVIKQEKRWLNNECIEKCVFQAALGKSSPVMLFSAGAEIRQVLMQGEYASIEISNVDTEIEDREILSMFDKCAEGIAGFRRVSSLGNGRKWGTVTFCSSKGAAEAVSFLHNVKVGKRRIEVKPSITSNPNERCRPLFPAVRATLTWPRRQTKGHAMVRCRAEDQSLVIRSCSGMLISGSRILCKPDYRAGDKGIFIHGLGTEVTETELQQVLQQTTGCTLEDVFIPRWPPSDQPTIEACREALVQEIQRFVPLTKFQAFVTGSHLDYVSKAVVKFDENEHEGAASAIAYLQGRTLSICKPWQTISCQETFSSSVQCSGAIYSVLKEDISDLVLALKQQNEGAELTLTRGGNGGCFVQISAGSLRTVAGCKSALEKLIEGMVVADEVDEAELRLLFTTDGLQMVKSVELQTRTHIVCDKRSQTVRVFGPTERKNRALKRLVRNLSQLQERKKCHEIELRGGKRPSGLMREIVRKFGVDLVGLKVLVEGACLSLDHRRHILLIRGSREDVSKVEKTVEEVSWALRGSECGTSFEAFNSEDCRICFCEVEDKYSLVGCGHGFCRACVREQIMSAIRHREGFPLTCAYPDCSQRLLLSDLEMLLTVEHQDELGKASLSAFVALNRGKYRFCTTPDCPAVYRVTDQSKLFTCGACSVRLCTSCHVEFHFGLTCDQYEEFKQDPDLSLKSWRKGKQHVKCCPSCGSTIEKVDGCNHVLCNCKTHLCWLCLWPFQSSEDCYSHLQNIHGGFA